jgi:hypothetical protein
MKNLPPYRRPYRNTQPEYLFPAYASTVKRAPREPLVVLPHTLSEVTARESRLPPRHYSNENPGLDRAPGFLFLRFLFRGIGRAGASGGLMANQRLLADNPMKL